MKNLSLIILIYVLFATTLLATDYSSIKLPAVVSTRTEFLAFWTKAADKPITEKIGLFTPKS